MPHRRVLLLFGSAALVTAAVLPFLIGRTPNSEHLASRGHTSSKPLVKLVADDASVTVASGSYDMTYNDTTTPPTNCPQEIGGNSQPVGGGAAPAQGCQVSPFPDISGHGTVDTSPYAMVTISQVGALGKITLYDNGTNVWEIGGGDYGLAGPGQAGPGAPLSGYASSVEGTLGQQAGALDMQGLASGTGYLDLEAQEIQGATPAGTGTVDGVPVTIYKLSQSGLQDPDLTGLTAEQVATIRAADAIIQQSGFSGKTTWVSVDANGYIREVHSVYTLSDGSAVTGDTGLSNFGCAGTVLMPGQGGATAPPPGCVSPDTAGSGTVPASPTTTTSTTTPQSPSTAVLSGRASAVPVPVNGSTSTTSPSTAVPGSVTVPNVLGLSPAQASAALAAVDLDVEFAGNETGAVISESPAGNSIVEEQSIVVLRTQ